MSEWELRKLGSAHPHAGGYCSPARNGALDVDRGRPGIDRQIATATALLEFDTDRLWRVTFKPGHRYAHPLTAFAEAWKNLTPIGERRIKHWMTREDFTDYLGAWKRRAAGAGKRETVDCWVKETFSAQLGDKVIITFGPRRRVVGTGELTGDRWTFDFTSDTDHKYNPRVPVGVLRETNVARDEFSTRDREPAANLSPDGDARTAEQARPGANVHAHPAPDVPEPAGLGGVTLEDGTRLHFGQSKAEVEKLTGAEATEVNQIGARGD